MKMSGMGLRAETQNPPSVPELMRSFASLVMNPQVSEPNCRESMISITGAGIVSDGGNSRPGKDAVT